jgi:L-rhamnose isomerase
LEVSGDYTGRLALQDALKVMPSNAIWDYYCLQQEVPLGFTFINEIRNYEQQEIAWRR